MKKINLKNLFGKLELKNKEIDDFDQMKCEKTLTGHTSHVFCLEVLKTGEIVSRSGDNSIKMWDPITGQ